MLQGIERYLKQAIVDKNASVSSASLVSALVSFNILHSFYSCLHSSPLVKIAYQSISWSAIRLHPSLPLPPEKRAGCNLFCLIS